MTIFLNVIFFIFLVLLTSVNAKEQNPNIICSNYNKSILLEFLFINQNNYFDDDVFKKINSKFIKIGKIVGQKPKLFILFEDKYAFLGVDFAWHLDKKTIKKAYLSSNKINNFGFCPTIFPILINLLLIFLKTSSSK